MDECILTVDYAKHEYVIFIAVEDVAPISRLTGRRPMQKREILLWFGVLHCLRLGPRGVLGRVLEITARHQLVVSDGEEFGWTDLELRNHACKWQ